MHVVVGTIGFAVNALLLAWLARRLLGAPVGWPRTIALSLLLWLTAQPIVTYATELLGIARPEAVRADSGDLASYSLVLLLLAAWILVAEIAVLTVLELLVPTGSLPTPLHLARTWPARTRRARRLATITRIATRHGLGGYLRRRARRDRPHEALALDLRAALTDGGVTFVKLGQTLATREDLLPEAYVRELGNLHSDVDPEPWSVVQDRLVAELPAPVDTVFASVDPEPLAAASVAQVHTGQLLGGQDVVVKVQRPRAREQAVADLALVSGLADWLEERTDWGRRLGTRDLAAGFAESLREELDYRVEMDNMTAIAAAAGPRVRVPRVWRELSTSGLIVMERVHGQPLSRAASALERLTASERVALADDLLATVLRQVLVTGVFHADLHPGNIVLSTHDGADDAPAEATPSLVLLDFGSVGRLDRSTRDGLALLLLAFDRQDDLAAADALIEVLGRPAALDDRAFERALGALLVGARSTDLVPRMMRVVLAHGFAVPPMVAAAFRDHRHPRGQPARARPRRRSAHRRPPSRPGAGHRDRVR